MEEDSDTDEDWSKPVEENNNDNQTSPGLITGTSTTVERTSLKNQCESQHLRTILHIDMDCFYAQVEMIKNPSLTNIPIGIQQKYIIVTCNYPARALGVTKLMSIKDAKTKCPSLIMVSGEDLTDYRKMSYKISEYLLQYTSKVERLGFDENFLDITDLISSKIKSSSCEQLSGYLYGVDQVNPQIRELNERKPCFCGCHQRLAMGSVIASEIREGLFKDLGVTCCTGISYNKLLAKLVAGTHKPNQQTTLFPEETFRFVQSLPKASNIPGIGWGMAKRLASLGVVSVTDLFDCSCDILSSEFGEHTAKLMKDLASGIDDTSVVKYGLPQSISDEDSYRNLSVLSEVEKQIEVLVNNVLKRVDEDGRYPQTLRVTVRKYTSRNEYSDNRQSKQCPILSSIFNNKDTQTRNKMMSELAFSLLKKLVDVFNPFRLTLINICVTKFTKTSGMDISSFFTHKSTENSDTDKETLKIDGCLQKVSEGSSHYGSSAAKRKQTQYLEEHIKSKRLKTAIRNDYQSSNETNTVNSQISSLSNSAVDMDVYSQLPKEIQHEILQSYSTLNNLDSNNTCSPKQLKSPDSCFTPSSGSKIKRPDSKAKGNIASFFQKGGQCNGVKSETMSSNEEVNSTLIYHNNVSSVSVKPASTESQNNTSCEFIPPNIDKSVFITLPTEIQQELVMEWKIASGAKLQTVQKSPGILGYFKKK